MKKMKKKYGALILSIGMMMQILSPINTYATIPETMEIIEETISETENVRESTEQGESIEQSEAAEEMVYSVVSVDLENETVNAGNKQTIKINLNNSEGITDAVLVTYAANKSAEVEFALTSIEENSLVFEFDCSTDIIDDYTITSVNIQSAVGLDTLDLKPFDLGYSVCGLVNGQSTDNGISMFTLGDKLAGKYANDGKFVVVIDPGHDIGCNDRAEHNGVWETELNWNIAWAMQEELKKYADVEVHINRYWDECPGLVDYGETGKCIKARAERGAKLEADLFVSIHNNALGHGELQYSANGSYAFISQYTAYNSESKVLGNLMLDKLAELGIKKNSVLTKAYGDSEVIYDDGVEQDYYGVNRYSTLEGVPSILIEHAFMDNPTDLTFLQDDAVLVQMGQKDAQAVAEYYGLKLKGEETEDTEETKETELPEETETSDETEIPEETDETELPEETEDESGTESAIPQMPGKWIEDEIGWKFCLNDGSCMQNEWLLLYGTWYYLDEDGYMKTGWFNNGYRDYYFDEEGVLQTGWFLIEGQWYYAESSGESVRRSWVLYNNQWYYMDETGKMVSSSWRVINNINYYFKASGVMATKWALIDSDWYYFDNNGKIVRGWLLDKGAWYYLDINGKMVTGIKEINGDTYCLADDGSMIIGLEVYDGKSYYANSQGILIKGWVFNNGCWYYMGADYAAVTGWFADYSNRTFYMDSSGVMLTGAQNIDGCYYYFDLKDGYKVSSIWQYVEGKKYYFDEEGKLVQNIENIIGKQSKYHLEVNTYDNTVSVYAYDAATQKYVVPVKKMICSTGVEESPTIQGSFKVRRLGRWWGLAGGVYGQYCSQFYGDYLFHSVPYYEYGNQKSVSVSEFEKLGENASHGCVRLLIKDAKWIYENCVGSTVDVFAKVNSNNLFDKPMRPDPIIIEGDYGCDPTQIEG